MGWRIKFDESGADVRLSSMYAPKGKMGLTIKFSSQEGHFGTMQMTGGMSKGLEESRHFWVVERQSVPGFLAQVTTEMFEKTTVSTFLCTTNARGAGRKGRVIAEAAAAVSGLEWNRADVTVQMGQKAGYVGWE